MFFNTYEYFKHRMSSFNSGKYYVDLIELLIPLGSEQCFISSEKQDNEPIQFLIANENMIVKGSVDWAVIEKISIQFESFRRKDVIGHRVLLSDPMPKQELNPYTRLNNLSLELLFQDGRTLTLFKKDYSPEMPNFSQAVQTLIK
ncbi:hypothetical protein [Paenibacillus humicus]|uniref:hypothetical protein n=1 Tax=Paenibacillus humicus TaxID=412861 RepID=UPI003F1508F6